MKDVRGEAQQKDDGGDVVESDGARAQTVSGLIVPPHLLVGRLAAERIGERAQIARRIAPLLQLALLRVVPG